jgi:hypothetical protein
VASHKAVVEAEAGRVPFVFTEVFSFTRDRISRLETFHINVAQERRGARLVLP